MVPWITMPTVLKHYYLILLKGPNYLIHFLVIWIPTEFFSQKIFRSRCNRVTFLGNYCSPRKKILLLVAYTDHQIKTLLCLLTNSTMFSHQFLKTINIFMWWETLTKTFSNTIIKFQHRNLLTANLHTPFFLSSPIQHASPHTLRR